MHHSILLTATIALFSLPNSIAQGKTKSTTAADTCPERKSIICDAKTYTLTPDDCKRGLVWIYCVKRLSREPRIGESNLTASGWVGTAPWRQFHSTEPILSQPCLSMDRGHLLLICWEEQCNNSHLEEDIQVCVDRFNDQNVNYAIEQKHSLGAATAVAAAPDPLLIGLLVALAVLLAVFLLLQAVSACSNQRNLKSLQHTLLMRMPLPDPHTTSGGAAKPNLYHSIAPSSAIHYEAADTVEMADVSEAHDALEEHDGVELVDAHRVSDVVEANEEKAESETDGPVTQESLL